MANYNLHFIRCPSYLILLFRVRNTDIVMPEVALFLVCLTERLYYQRLKISLIILIFIDSLHAKSINKWREAWSDSRNASLNIFMEN